MMNHKVCRKKICSYCYSETTVNLIVVFLFELSEGFRIDGKTGVVSSYDEVYA